LAQLQPQLVYSFYLLTKFRKITGSFGYIYGKEEDKWSI